MNRTSLWNLFFEDYCLLLQLGEIVIIMEVEKKNWSAVPKKLKLWMNALEVMNEGAFYRFDDFDNVVIFKYTDDKDTNITRSEINNVEINENKDKDTFLALVHVLISQEVRMGCDVI